MTLSIRKCLYTLISSNRGYNNGYLIETRNELALRYNDQSVLENHHVAASYSILANDDFNFLKHLNNVDFKKFREIMIHVILSTDMAKHFADLGKFKSRLNAPDFKPDSTDKMLCLDMSIHLADISNTTKSWSTCKRWIDLLFDEFFS